MEEKKKNNPNSKLSYKTGEEFYTEHLHFCSRIYFNVFKPWGTSSVCLPPSAFPDHPGNKLLNSAYT